MFKTTHDAANREEAVRVKTSRRSVNRTDAAGASIHDDDAEPDDPGGADPSRPERTGATS